MAAEVPAAREGAEDVEAAADPRLVVPAELEIVVVVADLRAVETAEPETRQAEVVWRQGAQLVRVAAGAPAAATLVGCRVRSARKPSHVALP
jgi:hypothetical protein